MKRVLFYYDFSCPYAYLGHTQIEAVCQRGGAELVWKPMLLGGVFKALGAEPSMSPPRMRLNAIDMYRWAKHWDVPLVMPAEHPCRTVLALRAVLRSGDIPRASKAMFAAYWVRGQDVSQPDVVRATLDAAGFDGASLVRAAEDPAVKDELRARTDEAIAAGVFGAPTVVVTTSEGSEPELFWGQDRLVLVERLLGGSARHEAARPVEPSKASSKALDFYFDFSSPFAYLAATQVAAVAARSGAPLRYRPFLLGALFKAVGTANVPFFTMPPPKQRHTTLDMDRWAAHWGVPFRFASRFPILTLKPLRMVLELPEDRRALLVDAIFRAYWVEDRDIADDAVLSEIATSIGLDGAALLAATKEERVKQALKEATDHAAAAGLCGAPSFVVRDSREPGTDQLYWGQDRLELVERALG